MSYLLDESETDSQSHIDQDMFILEAKENFGSKGAKEAQDVYKRQLHGRSGRGRNWWDRHAAFYYHNKVNGLKSLLRTEI